MTSIRPDQAPNIDEIRAARQQLGDLVSRTPVIRSPAIEQLVGGDTEVFLKLEFLQRTGTFKARGALTSVFALSDAEKGPGVTAVSAGNHAIATAYAAQATGVSAKVVMTRTASPCRVAACESYGADVVFADDVHQAFDVVNAICKDEGRRLIHPFEGRSIALGTGTLGLEVCEQIDHFDALLIPVGGGGLIGGCSNAVKQVRSDCSIYGIEPTGADSMHRSFASGKPEPIETVKTIADSLGAPFAMPYSFELTKNNIDQLVLVDDDDLRRSMGILFSQMSIAVEPACAATTAALLGPLRETLRGRRVVLILCGSNIDWATYSSQAVFDDVA